jgi:ribosomal-protein-alanine N-acetyltransferase
MASTTVTTRWMIRVDIPKVMEIECYHSFYSERFEPIEELELIRLLKERSTVGIVILLNDEVVGYMIYELRKDHLNLLRLVIHPEYEGHRYGETLINKLKGKLSKERRTAVHTRVDDWNVDALNFLKRLDFKYVGFHDDCVTMSHSVFYSKEESNINEY